MLLAATGCGRIDTLRLAHANGGTPVEWSAGSLWADLELEVSADGRPWLPVSVDGNAPIPFLVQASAGAVAITGARAAGFGPVGAGRLRLHGELLPGIPGGLLVKQRRLDIDTLSLGNQSLLLVDAADWPHGRPRPGAAGVLGYDLLRRFPLEFDVSARRLSVYRRNGLDIGAMDDVRRLALLGRRPYFEAALEYDDGPGRWLRLQFEPGEPSGICLDAGPFEGAVTIAGRRLEVGGTPCSVAAAGGGAGRDGVFGAGALRQFVVAVDYERGQIGFRPRD